jgi:hypothetical protein
MEEKFGTFEKKSYKKIGINRYTILQKSSRTHPPRLTEGMKMFWKAEIRTGCRETKKIQIKLATTGKKNGQQQDA